MVRDVRRALAFYARLGFQEVFRDDDTAPMFAMVARDAACLAMQWHDFEGVAGQGCKPGPERNLKPASHVS